jgi:WD40 repeat protein
LPTGFATTLSRDAATGTPIGQPLQHDGPVFSIAFSPDGTKFATGSLDKTARLWDVATGKPIGEPLKHQDWVRSVAFSPDGTKLATGSVDKTARLWNVATGKPIGEPLKHQGLVVPVAFSPDGTTLATGSRDLTARLWDVATGKPIGQLLQHQGSVNSVAFSPDGTILATGSSDNTARLWDVATGKLIGQPLQHQDFVGPVAFSPDGTKLATGSWDKTARLWRLPARPSESPDHVLLWVESLCGVEVDEDGLVSRLSADRLAQKREQLAQLGGPPKAWLEALDRRGRIAGQLAAAEKNPAPVGSSTTAGNEKLVVGQKAVLAAAEKNPAPVGSSRSAGNERLVVGRKLPVFSKCDWSLDGTQIVVTKESSKISDAGLEVRDLVTMTVRNLTARGKDPAWSPVVNGDIAFVRMTDGGVEEVWLIQPDGTHDRRIGAGSYPHWSQDGKTLYYRDPGRREIMAIGPGDPKNEPHAVCTMGESDYPVVFPDGHHLAYISGGSSLVVETCPSRQPVKSWPLSSSSGGGLVAWHPGGEQLVYGGWPTAPTGLWLADLKSGKTYKVIDGAAWKPAWSKDGKHLLYVLDNEIYIVATDKLPVP